MDPLDIVMHGDRIEPHFQAIFSADSHEILGYEVLGKLQDRGQLVSLGSFFHDLSVPDDFKIEIDLQIQRLAIDYYLEQQMDQHLFLNVGANYFAADTDDRLLNQLLEYQEKGLDLSKIVIEIMGHEASNNTDSLSHTLKYLQTFGVKVVIDELGTGISNVEEIMLLEPDILKVDLEALQSESTSTNFNGMIHYLSMLAHKLGAELLFNGITSNYQFHYAWRHNGRYYQGDLLSEVSPVFLEKGMLKDRFRHDIQQFIEIERNKVQAKFKLTHRLNEQVSDNWKEIKKNKPLDEQIDSLAKTMGDIFFRMYVTDEDGFQQTVNVVHEKTDWSWDTSAKGKNWSWRPYFIENVIRMKQEQIGILSDLYNDIDTGERIRTFSYPLDEHYYLFMDISPMYLDANEDLLW
ncbi:EAL domain-containing protein [Gracilibacillus alcaliphilus]|uniref:EAL domain-containing protein n=1 Tax=Gracilibacillus alcaliphilus TaxID=1401441 RepID=UPI00195D8E51|nr:EAL-associated domain-containing protein [Gracilibacillus alcaliphilus]MBM7678179.1 EAL domain-containing protein (putative c-di-GMP-specific phosphodiesterase class I) [Gracilibacillus alcaliphilus]